MRAVCKLAAGLYTPDRTTWVKVKNRAYSQAEGRADFFNGRTLRAAASKSFKLNDSN